MTGESRQGGFLGRVGSVDAQERGGVDWFRTLLRRRQPPRVVADLCFRGRMATSGELYVVALDCSGSVLRARRLAEAKATVVEFVNVIYRLRARIGFVTFRGAGVDFSFSGRRAPKRIESLIAAVPGGGGTPLRAGVEEVRRVLARERKRFPAQRQRVLFFTDGRSREKLDGAAFECPSLLVDMEGGPVRLGRSPHLARALGADYIHMDALPAATGSRTRKRRKT